MTNQSILPQAAAGNFLELLQSSVTQSNSTETKDMLDVPPINWPQQQTVQSPARCDSAPAAASTEHDFFSSTSKLEEAEFKSMPAMDRFETLLATISSLPDGALKDLHYAVIEAIVQGAFQVSELQRLIPDAGVHYGELYHDAIAGGTQGLEAFGSLRRFQSMLTSWFGIAMRVSDEGLFVGEQNPSGTNAWTFVPTNGAISAGTSHTVDGPDSRLRPEQALSRIRTKLSRALDFAIAAY